MANSAPQAGSIHAVVVLSGGMDSAVCASLAVREHGPEAVAALHVDYGQRTETRERRAFAEICARLRIARRLVVQNQSLSQIGGSALTDRSRDAIDARRPGSSVPDTYVPFRNTHLLAVAASWGEVLGARRLVIGAVEEDSSGYPDCRASYYEAFNALLRLGTRPETALEVVTPVIAMSKAEIVRQGLRLQAPLHLTWSCYTEDAYACGRCESCLLRLKGFREAGAEDPIPYRT